MRALDYVEASVKRFKQDNAHELMWEGEL